MKPYFVVTFLLLLLFPATVQAQSENVLQPTLQKHFAKISRSSVKTVQPILDEIVATQSPRIPVFLEKWQQKGLWFRKSDKMLFFVKAKDGGKYSLIGIDSGEIEGEENKKTLKQIKPNSGVREILSGMQIKYQLFSPDIESRRTALNSLARDADAENLEMVRRALETETDAELRQRLETTERLLSIAFDTNDRNRIKAIKELGGSLTIEARAALSTLLYSSIHFSNKYPTDINLARKIAPDKTVSLGNGLGRDYNFMDWFSDRKVELSEREAYQLLVDAGEAPARISKEQRDEALVANIRNGKVGGIAVAEFVTEAKRDEAYSALAGAGIVPPSPDAEQIAQAVKNKVFYAAYDEPNPAVTDAARRTLASTNSWVSLYQFFDLALDAISLASIFFLAAIGLSITFGVMRVINMAHGEFIMMGAYSAYMVQQYVPNYTLSVIIAIPVAFCLTFAAGVVMERLVIRHLYHRPLETLLATFGVSIALQQIAKNIFGTQARPLTAPQWLNGSLVINDVISISLIRIAIFVLSLLFMAGIWWVLNKSRFGLETRAVTQHPKMAASMGINPDRINMLTFGLGSGIAGIAGVAIGLYAKVTSEMGGDYIVQSFMTVVIGGVGNVWGALAGASLTGGLQKLIESVNPSNTLAAQTYMIIFVIIFIQFRPRGLFALKGREVEA